MADAWGGAWGSAWGVSWGAAVVARDRGDAADYTWDYRRDRSYERRKRRSYEKLQEELDRHLKELAEQEKPQKAKPKTRKVRKAETRESLQRVEPERTYFVPQVFSDRIVELTREFIERENITARRARQARYKKQLDEHLDALADEMVRRQDEDDIAAILEMDGMTAFMEIQASLKLLPPVLEALENARRMRKAKPAKKQTERQ